VNKNNIESDNFYIYCEDLFKIYKLADLEVVALRGLDLKVRRGELIAIVGASGSGKSTLLNILGGLETASAGQVRVGGRDLLNMAPHDLVEYRRKDAGFVWQQGGRNLIPYLTAFQNVELPLILLGWRQKERRQRVEELLTAVGLKDRMNSKPVQLSGGEQQRIAIAIGIAHNPPLLLADEPTGELDSQNATEILDLLRSLNRTYHITVVIVTHDINVMSKVDRVITIRDGRASLEAMRTPTTFRRPDPNQQPFEEFILLDKAGRLQLPKEYVDKLKLENRIRVTLNGDNLTILPDRPDKKEDK
jgi:ABC-type lipoprotein export system ATPase subunit